MKRTLHILALTAASLAPAANDFATSANYAISTSLDGGGRLSTSANYANALFITPISARLTTSVSVAMLTGFASRLNSAPIAENDFRSHPGSAVNILGASLFANDTDPDGDTLRLVSVDPQSAQGGTVVIDGFNVIYTPPAGLTGPDQFNYVVADANGDIATATVLLGSAPPVGGQGLNTVLIAEQPDGKYLVRFRQVPGKNDYQIQYKHDLNDPQWRLLKRLDARADGIVEALFDPTVAEQTYFRAVSF